MRDLHRVEPRRGALRVSGRTDRGLLRTGRHSLPISRRRPFRLRLQAPLLRRLDRRQRGTKAGQESYARARRRAAHPELLPHQLAGIAPLGRLEGCARGADSRGRGDRITTERGPPPGALPRKSSPGPRPARRRRPGRIRPRTVGPLDPPRRFHLPHPRQAETPPRVELPPTCGPHQRRRRELPLKETGAKGCPRSPALKSLTASKEKTQRRKGAKTQRRTIPSLSLRPCVFAFDSPEGYRARSPRRNARSRFRDTSRR